MTVRTRFAPSPTGYLHIGGLRTALYCYLLAKKEGGQFILRIEDTDQKRLVQDALDNLVGSLDWAGLQRDEGPFSGGDKGPYIQSERLDIYKEYADKLLGTDHAYHCFCSKDDLDQMRERQKEFGLPPKYDGRCSKLSSKEVSEKLEAGSAYVIRQKIPASRTVEFVDSIRGRVKFESKDLEDQVLFKSDGFPTYHLANVVDDHLMEITHVIRGEEWVPSTPKHILLYEAFGWKPPQFVHLPLILNKDKTKLSKRQNDVSTDSYREKGYLKEALVNFIALLGWNPGDNREIFSLDELTEIFSLDRVQKSGAVFDVDKLDWFNWQWRRRLFLDELKSIARDVDPSVEITEYKPNHFSFKFANIDSENEFTKLRSERLYELVKEHLSREYDYELLLRTLLTVEEKVLQDAGSADAAISFYFESKYNYSNDLLLNADKGITKESSMEALRGSINMLNNADFSTPDKLKEQWVELISDLGLKTGQVLWPCRVALSNEEFSPGVFEMAWAFGKDKTIDRLQDAVSYLEKL